jgi:hypothetical protein
MRLHQRKQPSIVPSGTGRFFCTPPQHFVLGFFHLVPSGRLPRRAYLFPYADPARLKLGLGFLSPSSFVPPPLRYGAAFSLRARRSSKSEGGSLTMGNKPCELPFLALSALSALPAFLPPPPAQSVEIDNHDDEDTGDHPLPK